MEEPGYAFANRAEEHRRLERQAEVLDPLTERVFRAAGLRSGMRVLDLGSGAGDVAMLAARLVGADGEVVGVERDPEAVASAAARVEQARLANVRFVVGDVQTLDAIDGEFDAIVGRLVLMYVPDPVGVLVRAAELLRAGGLVCVQEGDMAYDWAQPMTPLWTQMRAWFLETLKRAGFASRMGLSLYSTFVAAGLPAPQMRLECAVAGGAEAPVWGWANLMRGVLPLMERLGVATAAELEPDTLTQRLLDDVVGNDGICIAPPLVGVWARTPA
jgi:ubiquinone/menaquinone biosynthesis C-methylase UbiE